MPIEVYGQLGKTSSYCTVRVALHVFPVSELPSLDLWTYEPCTAELIHMDMHLIQVRQFEENWSGSTIHLDHPGSQRQASGQAAIVVPKGFQSFVPDCGKGADFVMKCFLNPTEACPSASNLMPNDSWYCKRVL